MLGHVTGRANRAERTALSYVSEYDSTEVKVQKFTK